MQFHKENIPGNDMGRLGANGALAMGSLLANMNHDIRTSMNGVRGMLDLLLDTGLTPSQQQYARTVQHSMDHLLESLERIVDMSLIESNQFHLSPAPFDLLQEMKAALVSKPASARSKGIGLTIEYPAAIVLHGDAARLREAASGLVDLALQCAAGGSITISVNTTSPSPDRRTIELAVHVSKLTEAGEKLSTLLAPPLARESTPLQFCDRDTLAPALCGHLVRLMGGTIQIERGSAAGSTGSAFRLSIELPLAATPLASVRGLLVSENAAEWQSALQPLARHGIQVDAFDSAMPALEAIMATASGHTPYRVVMLGRHVQGMDASVLVGAIKANPAYREARFALLDDTPVVDTDNLAREGFVAHVCRLADHSSVESTLVRLWTAAANGSSMPFLSTGTTAMAQTDEDIPLTFPGRRILVADDNQVNQQVAARMLEKLGCQCALADNGSQAVAMHVAERFDLILMDCEMPVLDGLKATTCIREGERSGRRTPIIALTACTGQGEQEQCIAAGMDDFLSKPIRPQMLRDMLARWLPANASAVEAPAVACGDELDAVKEMFGADFAELAALYRNDGLPRIVAIREAFSTGDCAHAAKVAHAFAGSSASIGATGLSALCKEVEISAKAGSFEAFENRMAAIEAEYVRVCSKLQSLLNP